MINSRLNVKINLVSDIKEVKRKPYKREEPYLCPTCRKVWQPTSGHIYQQYVDRFPKYGCTKRVCRQCEPKGEPK